MICNATFERDIRFYTTPICEWCGMRPATDMHHCLIGRDKHNPALDDEHNIGHVCRWCHLQWIGTGGRKVREAWWGIQCRKYGEADMRRWYDGLKLKSKEMF